MDYNLLLQSTMNSFQARRVSRSHLIILNDEPGKIFNLFTPEEEKKWAPGWDFIPLYPEEGTVEKNMMFTTTGHDHAKQDALWIVCNYKPLSFCIEYLRIEPGIKIGKIEVVCDEAGNGKTSVMVKYTYTSLSDEGNLFLDSFTEEFFSEYISFWEKAINHYLRTGEMIPE